MSDNTIERVAKALCEAEGEQWRTGTYPIASGPNFEWEDHSADELNNHWRYKAQAAIEAMREPMKALAKLWIAEMQRQGAVFDIFDDCPDYPVDLWEGLIDASLPELNDPDDEEPSPYQAHVG